MALASFFILCIADSVVDVSTSMITPAPQIVKKRQSSDAYFRNDFIGYYLSGSTCQYLHPKSKTNLTHFVQIYPVSVQVVPIEKPLLLRVIITSEGVSLFLLTLLSRPALETGPMEWVEPPPALGLD